MTLLQRKLEAQLGATDAHASTSASFSTTADDPGSVCWIPGDGKAPAHAPQLLMLGVQVSMMTDSARLGSNSVYSIHHPCLRQCKR